MQEFFFQTYCVVTSQREHFLESPEGFTYIPYKFQDSISKRLLTPFVSDRQYTKWTSRIKQLIRRTKLQETDDADSEYIDVDILISQFLEEFKIAKQSFGKELYKQFMRMLETKQGRQDLTLDNYVTVFNACKKRK